MTEVLICPRSKILAMLFCLYVENRVIGPTAPGRQLSGPSFVNDQRQ